MNAIKDADLPDWYHQNKNPDRKTKKTTDDSVGSSIPQTSIKQFTLPSVTNHEKDQFQEHITMHLYATGTSFHCVEDVHLQEAIRFMRPDDNLLPTRR